MALSRVGELFVVSLIVVGVSTCSLWAPAMGQPFHFFSTRPWLCVLTGAMVGLLTFVLAAIHLAKAEDRRMAKLNSGFYD